MEFFPRKGVLPDYLLEDGNLYAVNSNCTGYKYTPPLSPTICHKRRNNVGIEETRKNKANL